MAEELEVRKHFAVAKVATASEGEGRFTAIVSVFNTLDSQGDIVSESAFDESIEKFAAGGWVLPVVWSHDFWNADSVIGEVVALGKAEVDVDGETRTGLLVEGILDVDESETARTVFRNMRRGRIVEFSFSGVVKAWSIVRSDDADDGALRLERIELWEVGPCFKGANSQTALLSVKSRVLKQHPELTEVEADVDESPDVEPAEQAEPEATPEPDAEPEPAPDADEAPADPEPPRLSRATRALLGLIPTLT